MKRKFKVCVVGCGVISGNHIPSLLRLDNVEIAAICDINTEKAESKKEEFNLSCPIYSDYLEMLDEIKPDSVHILTPHYLHTEMTLEAIRLADNDGGAVSAFATVVWNRNDEYYASGDWRGKWATEGGGALINQAIHTIDLLCIFLGNPQKIQANISTMRHCEQVEVEDTCALIVDYENGKRANILVTTTYSGSDSTTLSVETKNHRIELRNSELYLDSAKINIDLPTTYMGKKCYGNSHMTLIEKFYDALSTGNKMPISIRDSANAMRIVLGAYKSNSKILDI